MEEKRNDFIYQVNKVRNRNKFSVFFQGGIHESDIKELDRFRENCQKKNLKYNYDGEHRECGYLTMLRRNNKIESTLIPIAKACNSNPDVFINRLIDKFLENVILECKQNNLTIQIENYKKELIDKTVSSATKDLQILAVKRNNSREKSVVD